jgi:hypothetical protein
MILRLSVIANPFLTEHFLKTSSTFIGVGFSNAQTQRPNLTYRRFAQYTL